MLQVDVAENMSRFVFDDAPVFEDGYPAYGNTFITEGYVYPHDFLDGRDGVTAEGEPAFPEHVLGRWTCRGVFVGEGAHTSTGPMVLTTQTFDMRGPQGSSGHTLVTEGFEVVEPGAITARAVTGGTGLYRNARGEATQTFLGLNASEGVNLRITLDLD